MHDFYVKPHARQKLSHAVACTSVAPLGLHCLICHAGINTWLVIAASEEDGGGLITILAARGRPQPPHQPLLRYFKSARRLLHKYFFKATARPKIRLWQKVTRNQILNLRSSVVFDVKVINHLWVSWANSWCFPIWPCVWFIVVLGNAVGVGS